MFIFHYFQGFIRVIFDLLYDEDIINEAVFWAWQSDNPWAWKSDVREDGHALSVLSLKAFFEWLSEVETDNHEY